ncbi:MAG: transcription elongation factor subunit Spt4 [Candidatus Woesearchaeota archaeon]|jgi:DNA-directed RNA polymerase subunit E"
MSKKKICKTCKLFVDGDKCPICNNSNFASAFNGRMYILDPNRSEIAKKIGIKAKGEYAIKIK